MEEAKKGLSTSPAPPLPPSYNKHKKFLHAYVLCSYFFFTPSDQFLGGSAANPSPDSLYSGTV